MTTVRRHAAGRIEFTLPERWIDASVYTFIDSDDEHLTLNISYTSLEDEGLSTLREMLDEQESRLGGFDDVTTDEKSETIVNGLPAGVLTMTIDDGASRLRVRHLLLQLPEGTVLSASLTGPVDLAARLDSAWTGFLANLQLR
jgi:hypothetical protein